MLGVLTRNDRDGLKADKVGRSTLPNLFIYTLQRPTKDGAGSAGDIEAHILVIEKRPGRSSGRSTRCCGLLRSRGYSTPRSLGGAELSAIADQAQQHEEQVDEVEIERQRAHHGLAASRVHIVRRVVHLLDLLGVPGGQPGEDQHARG